MASFQLDRQLAANVNLYLTIFPADTVLTTTTCRKLKLIEEENVLLLTQCRRGTCDAQIKQYTRALLGELFPHCNDVW